MTSSNCIVGDEAYEITYRGIHPILLEKDEKVQQAVVRRHYSLENVLRQWLNEPGILLLDEGPGSPRGTWRKRSPSSTQETSQCLLLVDPTTHLPLEKRFSTRDPRYRERDEEVTIYGDWKQIQGINTPRMTVIKRNGETISQQIILNITYNTHPPDSCSTRRGQN